LWAKLRDIGIDDDTMREMGDSLREGEAALFLLLAETYTAHLSAELGRFDGTIIHSTFDHADTETFEQALRPVGI
jgi:uncharacterized membrane protein